MKITRRAGIALLMAVAACTDAGPRNIVAPEDVTPARNHVSYVTVCCGTTMYVGTSVTMYVTAYDQSNAVIQNPSATWSSSNNAVAWVSAGGIVQAVSPGYVWITATVDGASNAVQVQVLPQPVVTTVQITPSSPAVQVGQSYQLTATPYDQNGKPISGKTATWTIDHSSVASISSGGMLQGVSVGSTTVRATINGVTGTASVTVQPVLTVSINGPLWINTPGQQTWTASASGGNGTYSYRWYVEWNTSPHIYELTTGSTASFYVDEYTPSYFILYAEVTSGGQTAVAQAGICNFTNSAMC